MPFSCKNQVKEVTFRSKEENSYFTLGWNGCCSNKKQKLFFKYFLECFIWLPLFSHFLLNVILCIIAYFHPAYGAGVRTPRPIGHEPSALTIRPGFSPRNKKNKKNNCRAGLGVRFELKYLNFKTSCSMESIGFLIK